MAKTVFSSLMFSFRMLHQKAKTSEANTMTPRQQQEPTPRFEPNSYRNDYPPKSNSKWSEEKITVGGKKRERIYLKNMKWYSRHVFLLFSSCLLRARWNQKFYCWFFSSSSSSPWKFLLDFYSCSSTFRNYLEPPASTRMPAGKWVVLRRNFSEYFSSKYS